MIKKIFYSVLIIISLYFSYDIIEEYRFDKMFPYEPIVSTDNVARLTIYTRPFGAPIIWRVTGHSWLYIYNTSDKPIYISDIEIPSNTGLTLGTTAMPYMPHNGLWYNLESHNNTDYSINSGYSMDINNDDIDYINTYLLYHDKWSLYYNCSTFAADLWNSTSAGVIPFKTGTPLRLKSSIEKIDDFIVNGTFKTGDFMMYKNNDENIFIYD